MAVGDVSQLSDLAYFGPFCVHPTERSFLKEGMPVAMGSRCLDILIALIERPGEIVSSRNLIDRVWPDVTVEKANLRVHVATLRKVLGDGQGGARYIANVRGRGYCFVAPVQRAAAPQRTSQTVSPQTRLHRLPPLLTRMVGRKETVAALTVLLTSRRFVTIAGIGGMGKTTVAVAVAHALVKEFEGEVYFVDLSVINDAALVAGAVGSALGCSPQAEDPISRLLSFVTDKRILLVLDSSEHVIEAVAALAERLFNETSLVHILTTSSEPLRVEGENVHRLQPLDGPLEGSELTTEQVLASPAAQLFMERAIAGGYRSSLKDADAPVVAGICRRLDGIALAIELVASQVGAYGIRGTADLLDNRFKLLWQGRRHALPRHQTLRAMLDWSYNLLTEYEQTVLWRLSAFVSHFTIEGALSVADDTTADALKVAETLGSLVNKSLVWTSEIEGATYHRLPDVTRSYAAAKLAERGEQELVAKRHALYYAGLFTSDTTRAAILGGRDVAVLAPHMGNVRAALDWCFSSTGAPAIAIELAARSAALFLGLSLLSECERWCERAREALREEDRGTERELALQEALAISSMFTRGNGDDVRAAIERGLDLAAALQDWSHQFHLLAGLNMFETRVGNFHAALSVAERTATLAKQVGDTAGIVMAEWMLGAAYHLVGDQAAAQRHCEVGLKLAAAWDLVDVVFFGCDHRVRALVALARALWLRGRPERALEFARQALDEATARGRAVTICISLIHAIPVFLWTGDHDGAQEHIERLIAHATKHSLVPHRTVGLALRGELMISRGELGAGIQLLQKALATLRAEQHLFLETALCRAMAEGLARYGQFDNATAMITAAIELAERNGEPYDLPDLLRARATIFSAEPRPDLAAAERSLVRSLQLARKQSALSWELRTAIQLAQLWAENWRAPEAKEMLAAVYGRFTEGFETADLRAAGQLLEELRHISHGLEPAYPMPSEGG